MDKNITFEDVVEKFTRGEIEAYSSGVCTILKDTASGRRVILSGDKDTGTFSIKTDEGDSDGQGPYRGFLIIRCDSCGTEKGFCTKHETYAYRCDECREVTVLEGLRSAYMKCRCGETFRYRTNIQDEEFSHRCIKCGSKIHVKLNGRRTAYITDESMLRK